MATSARLPHEMLEASSSTAARFWVPLEVTNSQLPPVVSALSRTSNNTASAPLSSSAVMDHNRERLHYRRWDYLSSVLHQPSTTICADPTSPSASTPR